MYRVYENLVILKYNNQLKFAINSIIKSENNFLFIKYI